MCRFRDIMFQAQNVLGLGIQILWQGQTDGDLEVQIALQTAALKISKCIFSGSHESL